MNFTNLFAQILFGSIGFGCLIYAKKQSNFKVFLIGTALSIYPYFVQNVYALYGIGIALTALLFVPS